MISDELKIDQLPDWNPGRLALKVKPTAEKKIRARHPWVFESSITKRPTEGRAGDVAVIFDQKKNKFLAAGLYDPYSPIRVKLLQFGRPATIDKNWLATKVRQAFEVRRPLLATDTDGYRLIHGENDGLPGFVADIYAETLVVKLYSFIWLPYLRKLLYLLLECSKCTTTVLRLSRNLQNDPGRLGGLFDGQILVGTLSGEEVLFREHGVLLCANVIRGHKTGFFLDQRHNRKKVHELAEGRTAIDIFSYAGGFTVHALAGGAREVLSLDISKQALKMARKNVALNLANTNAHQIMVADAFDGLQQLIQQKAQFDLVIVDPPSFAKRESEVKKALQSYAHLTELAIGLVGKEGILLMASCSSRVPADTFFSVVTKTLRHSGRSFEEIGKTYHDLDHPIGFQEGAYLKCGYYQL